MDFYIEHLKIYELIITTINNKPLKVFTYFFFLLISFLPVHRSHLWTNIPD